MSSFHQRPEHPGRAARARLGASASCLFVTILAANQAAARDAPSALPYLTLSAPAALRFAAARPSTPAPPPLHADLAEPVPPEPPAAASTAPPDAGATANPSALAPAVPVAPDRTAGDAASAPAAPALPILPDEYARPVPVTVQDLLPYFVPPNPPTSRATYEIK